MNGNGKRDRADKPLLGAVLCCTSVPPEQRTQYAEYAIQMGAEHKLDLTSDVTHLLVGDTNTPKYQYVAREREDVKVLRPEWVEAVRKCWMNDERINLNELEAKYTLPPLAGLKICITGFDDMTFRAQLQNAVADNGGEYTGDLTKDVTHLIAHTCEGKKFQYATQWEKKIVGLKWLKDSLERRMQLDETLYHPAKPPEEQGIGAWNRNAKQTFQPGKRPRPEPMAPDPPRKLRRTASARLGSQNENLWGDIVAGGGFDTPNRDRESLRPSRSMPAIRHEKQVNVNDSFADEEPVGGGPQPGPTIIKPARGFYADKSFCIMGFDSEKTITLSKVISENGGTALYSLKDLPQTADASYHDQFLLVPHTLTKSHLSQSYDLHSLPTLVSELWIECCMQRKAFVPPDQYPPGGLLEKNAIDGFDALVVNATGFVGVELLHVVKMVKLMGGKYEEIFKSTTSVLIFKTPDSTSQKARHASEWGVPTVDSAWLWSCMKSCQLRPFDDYLLTRNGRGPYEPTAQARQDRGRQDLRKEAGIQEQKRKGEAALQRFEQEQQKQQQEPKMAADDLLKERRYEELPQNQRPGSDFFEGTNLAHNELLTSKAEKVKLNGPALHEVDRAHETDNLEKMPLTEISFNSPPKSRPPSPQKKKPLFKSFDGNGSVPETEREGLQLPPASADLEPLVPTEPLPNAHSINGAIQDLLNMKARVKSCPSSNADNSNKKRKLLGRALSNLSNSSNTSNVRASRASSVDTMNTDGVGSEITAEISQVIGRPGSSSRSFTGRAKPREGAVEKPASIELGEMHREAFFAPEEMELAPQQTQLGYEDSEEAVLLREKLAERRRKKSREWQVDTELERERMGKSSGVLEKEQKRIKDDDAIFGGVGAGWGAGRRTRQKDKSPKGLKDF